MSGAENKERLLGKVEDEEEGDGVDVEEDEERGREVVKGVFWKRDWGLSMSKGSRFHCASLWTPFMFLAWGKTTHMDYIMKSNW